MFNFWFSLIRQLIPTVLQDKIVISITHRLNLMEQYDKIVVFNKGEVVGIGSYDELMDANPYFTRLYNGNRS